MIPLTILSLDTDETIRNLSIEFSVARLFMFLLIFNEQRVPKFTFVSVLTYYVKPHLFIDRDWMIYRKHPIRSLLTSMLRKASIRYPSDVHALSFEKYKESNYGEFLKGKNVLLCTRLYKYAVNLESLLNTQQYACVMCTL